MELFKRVLRFRKSMCSGPDEKHQYRKNKITDCYIALDRNFRFLKINNVAEREIFYRPASEITGKIIWEVYSDWKVNLTKELFFIVI